MFGSTGDSEGAPMQRIEWQEDTEPDDDGDFSATLVIISQDFALIRRARRIVRSLLDEPPTLGTVPIKPKDEDQS